MWLGENGCSLISGLFVQYRIHRLLALMGICRVEAQLLGELGLRLAQDNIQLYRPADRPRLPSFHEFELRTLCGIPSLIKVDSYVLGEYAFANPPA